MAIREASGAEAGEGIYANHCVLCDQGLKQPKLLPCFHSLCLSCLENMGKKWSKGPGDKMLCPVCGDEFTIPLEGFTRLETNVLVNKLLDLSHAICSDKKGCDGCEVDREGDVTIVNETRIAARYCVNCRQKLCKECLEHHKKYTTTRNHHVIEINDNALSSFGSYDVYSLCKFHSMQLTMYCIDCGKVLCETCFQEFHQNHKLQGIKTSSENFRTQIQHIIDCVPQIKSEVLMNNNAMKIERNEHFAHLENLRTEVVRRGNEIKELVDEQVKSLVDEVNSFEQKMEDETETHQQISDRFIATLSHFGNCCNEILTKASSTDICWAMSRLKLRADELRQRQLTLNQGRSSAPQISLERTELEWLDSGKIRHLIGNIRAPDEDQHRICSRPKAIRTIKTVAADKAAQEISGMAILDQELFLASSRSSTIEVYDALTFSYRRRLSVNASNRETTRDVDDIRSMASCTRNHCLYILNYESTRTCEILRIDGSGRTVAHWTTKHGEYGHSLSVTEEGNVVVTFYWDNKLKEYGPDGRLIRKYNLFKYEGINHPVHALKLNDGRFVICHGLNSDQLHRVCVIEPAGCLLRCFGAGKGSGMEQLNDPFFLALGAEGSIFVADWNNGRVLELNSDLRYVREVRSKEHGVRFPRCICLDVNAGRMFVADDKRKLCLIFDIR